MSAGVNIASKETQREAERLFKILGGLTDFKKGTKYDMAFCLSAASITLEINRLKKQKNAVILAHYYSAPDIVYAVADYRGDSYALSKTAAKVMENIIIFSGVYFMAETAKIINPRKRVFLPAVFAGCSLADSISAAQVKELRVKYPLADFICYINSTAEVKAECDVCVTSANVYDIVAGSKAKQIVFLPDVFMADNIRVEMLKRGIDKEIFSFGGTCCVHDKYAAQDVNAIRSKYPQAKVVCHPECALPVCQLCDYVGSTGGMLKYVRESSARQFAVLSEDGIINCMEYENPSKQFPRVSRTCAQMKRNNLHNILAALRNLPHEAEVKVEDAAAKGAKKAIDKMFERGA
ncbi:MAG: quinolinate synthase NadA [Elusimicrobiota bacterium]|jgi:quinolinate synthase|nr:quinolinate synthase NadA [Elusimicrobiota bacterium]